MKCSGVSKHTAQQIVSIVNIAFTPQDNLATHSHTQNSIGANLGLYGGLPVNIKETMWIV